MNASSAANSWPRGRLPRTGNRHRILPAEVMTISRPLPRSAMSRPPGNRPRWPDGVEGRGADVDGAADGAALKDTVLGSRTVVGGGSEGFLGAVVGVDGG